VKRDDVDVITSTFMAERTYSGARRTKVPCEGIADLPLLAFALFGPGVRPSCGCLVWPWRLGIMQQP
jgi:hypothetical protein